MVSGSGDGPTKTIGVDLWGGQERGAHQNVGTAVWPTGPAHERPGPRELFLSAYRQFAPGCREVDEPGVALVAVEERTGRPAGVVRLGARVDRHVAAIVGRHDECDLYLDGVDRLALRHLAIILDPVISWRAGEQDVRYRILDLRTRDGFADEGGRRLRGLRCEGPALLRCGGHALFALPLGDPTDWPARAEDAWAALPERVYFDEADHFPHGTRIHGVREPRHDPRDRRDPRARRSLITRTSGPRDSAVVPLDEGEIAGVLELVGPRCKETIRIGHAALKDGVLLGRYARCDGAGGLADDATLSRVHALLIQVDDAALVVDTASKNGTWEHGERPRARVFALGGATELLLGTTTRARWRWLS